MTTLRTTSTPIRIDMQDVHQIAMDLDSSIRLARENFDMERAMASYRKAYTGVRNLLHPTPLGQVEDAIIEFVDSLVFIPAELHELRGLLVARREIMAASK